MNKKWVFQVEQCFQLSERQRDQGRAKLSGARRFPAGAGTVRRRDGPHPRPPAGDAVINGRQDWKPQWFVSYSVSSHEVNRHLESTFRISIPFKSERFSCLTKTKTQTNGRVHCEGNEIFNFIICIVIVSFDAWRHLYPTAWPAWSNTKVFVLFFQSYLCRLVGDGDSKILLRAIYNRSICKYCTQWYRISRDQPAYSFLMKRSYLLANGTTDKLLQTNLLRSLSSLHTPAIITSYIIHTLYELHTFVIISYCIKLFLLTDTYNAMQTYNTYFPALRDWFIKTMIYNLVK